MSFRKRKKIKNFEIDNPLDELSFSRETDEINSKEYSFWQYKFFWFLLFGMIAILFLRTFYLQVMKGSYYKAVAENNRIRRVVIRAPRGVIKDFEGEVLARNIPSFELTFVPAYLPQEKAKLEELVRKISRITNYSYEELFS